MRLVTLVMALAVLAGCSHGIARGTNFSPESEDALFVFGTSANPQMYYTTVFAKYDPDQKRLDNTFFTGEYRVNHEGYGPRVQYHVIKVPPGDYVFRGVSHPWGLSVRTISLSKGSFSFRLLPGQVIYVGNIRFTGSGVESAGFDLPAARARIADLPKVQGDVVTGKLKFATFLRDPDVSDSNGTTSGPEENVQ